MAASGQLGGVGPRALITSSTTSDDWGWFGVEVTSAADLGRSREYADLDEQQRYDKAVDQQRAWLSRCWSIGLAGAVEVRWLSDGAGRVRLFLLGRVAVPVGADLGGAVGNGLELLMAAPGHVTTRPLDDDRDLYHALNPFVPAPDGAAAIRKRCVTGRPNRPDAGVAYYFAIQPFSGNATQWPALIAALAASRSPVMLTVGLQPARIGPDLVDLLHHLASSYRRLAERGQPTGAGIYRKARELGPDAFAVDAQHLYQDAARRLQGYVFRTRISVASPMPLDPGLLTAAAAVIGGSERSGRDLGAGDSVAAEFRGSAADVELPTGPTDTATFARNLVSLGFDDWGGHEAWSWSAPPPARLRPLTGLVDADEAVAAACLPIAVNGVLTGFPVSAPTFNVAVDHLPSGPTLRLGTQVAGGRDLGPLDISVNDLRTHALYSGTTGAGKSTAVLSLLAQLWERHRIPFLVLEPVNTTRDDYRRYLTTPGFEEAVVFTVGADHLAPLRLNPLEVPPGVTVGEHLANLLGAFDAAFGLFDPLPALYREALVATYAEAGHPLTREGDTSIDWPTLTDFGAELALVVGRQNYAGEVAANIEAASLVRIRQLSTGAAASVVDCRRSMPLASLLHRPVVLELAHLGSMNESEQALIMALVLVNLAEQLGRVERGPGLNHVTVVEEAHRLLKKPQPQGGANLKGDPSAAAANLFGNLLSEVRKHGEGLVIVDQDPDKLIADAYKNTNLKLMFRLQSQQDREVFGSAMLFDEDHTRAAGNLDTFMGFAHVAGMDRPAHIRSAAAELVAGGQLGEIAANDEVVARFRRLVQSDPAVARAIAPYAACDGCAAVCLHRSVSSTIASQSATVARFRSWTDEASDEMGADRWRDWHQRADEELGSLLATAGHPDTIDARACLFLHCCRRRWPNDDTVALVADHRNLT